ncbi:MAG: hypothetical protein ACRDD7_01965, partial [Peptostreptococcaceae bacterium]
TNKIEDNDLISEPIGKDKLILVSKLYTNCDKKDDLSIALLEDTLGVKSKIPKELNGINIFLKTDSFDVIKSYLKNTKTAAIVPNIAVEKELLSGDLNRLCEDGCELEYELFLTYRKDRSLKFKKKLKELKLDLQRILS